MIHIYSFPVTSFDRDNVEEFDESFCEKLNGENPDKVKSFTIDNLEEFLNDNDCADKLDTDNCWFRVFNH